MRRARGGPVSERPITGILSRDAAMRAPRASRRRRVLRRTVSTTSTATCTASVCHCMDSASGKESRCSRTSAKSRRPRKPPRSSRGISRMRYADWSGHSRRQEAAFPTAVSSAVTSSASSSSSSGSAVQRAQRARHGRRRNDPLTHMDDTVPSSSIHMMRSSGSATCAVGERAGLGRRTPREARPR